MDKITIGILTYNHEAFIEKCLNSVLALKYDNLEIIVSDDCSKDNTYQIVQDIVAHSQSYHNIILNRNEVNLGLAGNFNRTFYELATGDFLITLGGDDILYQYDIEDPLSYFKQDQKIMMVDFNAQVIDEKDNIKGVVAKLEFEQKTFDLNDYLSLKTVQSFAPGRMIRKELISSFPPISLRCPTEDSVLVVRSLLKGKLCRINKLNVLYRRHSENVSTVANLKKMSNIRIVSQYIKDAITLYDNSLISDELLLRLLARFEYEHKTRIIIYSDVNKYIKIIKRKFIKIKYKFQ